MRHSNISRLLARVGRLLVGTTERRGLDTLESRQLLAADLSVTLDSLVTTHDWLVPGDKVVFNVTVTNSGDETAVGEVDLKTGAQLAEKDISEEPDLLFSNRRVFMNLAPGASLRYKFTGKVPALFTPGDYRLGFGIDVPSQNDSPYASSNPVNDSNLSNNLAIADGNVGLHYRFGNWIGDTTRTTRTNLRLQVYFNEDGSEVPETGGDGQLGGWDDPNWVPPSSMVLINMALTGGGYGEVTPDGDGMVLTGTGASSALTFVVRTGSKRMTFEGDVEVQGSLRSFKATGVSFVDSDITVSGSLGDFSATAMTGSSLTVGSGAVALKFAATDLEDVSIQTPGGISSFRASSWTTAGDDLDDSQSSGDNSLTAAWVNQLTTLGSSTFDMNLSGEGARNGVALVRVAAKGVTSGDWSVRGHAGTLAFESTDTGFFATFAGGVSAVSTTGNLSGVLTAFSMTRVVVRGDLVDATLMAGAFIGDDLDIGGEGSDADATPAGATYGVIGQLAVTRGIINSSIYAGFMPGSEDEGSWITGQTSAVRKLSVGTELTESIIFAVTVPARIKIGAAQILTTEYPDVFVTA